MKKSKKEPVKQSMEPSSKNNMTALEWFIETTELRRLEAMELQKGHAFLSETIEKALQMEQEQLKGCSNTP
jgi:hypothetical protein